MKLSFKDIVNEEFYNSAMVVIVAGQYNIFNNMVSDELRDQCKSADDFVDEELMSEFGVSDKNKSSKVVVSNAVDFNTFMDVVDMPSINGKWFCSTDLSLLSKKQIEKFEKYARSPSKNGILVLVTHEFKDFKGYLRNKVFSLGINSHLIQLSFPTRTIAVTLVKKLFLQRKVGIDNRSAELFVMRMSSAYDEYTTTIDKICLGLSDVTLSYDQVMEGLKGIENYVLDDFIEKLLVPLSSDTVQTTRRVYKMLGALMTEMGPINLVNKLRFKVDDYIEFRVAINQGKIPIKVKFSIVEAKAKIGESSKISKISDFMFRKMANIAALTSLKDWMYMRLILNNTSFKFSVTANEKVLYSLVHRSILNNSRLSNDLGINSTMNLELEYLNGLRYDAENLILYK